MKISDLCMLLGGLALFLYGMQMMSGGLEAAAGNKMKTILEKLTANRFLGVLVGAGITAVIQSSSATTVMVVGFVNSGLMTLGQAMWIIMGANIGTTITGQLIALDISMIAPFIAFIGVVMIVFLKGEKLHHLGSIIAGLGVLFIGMDMMSSAMLPLRDSEGFIHLMTSFKNPVFGILAGMLFTAVIQSSSASVGILQALASGGLIGLSSSVFVLFGQNIGTCITAILASIGTSRNAKRTTILHLAFNVIGTCIFVAVCLLTPFTAFMESLTPGNPAAQIANVHTVFNVTTTLILLPFGGLLVKAAKLLLPDRGEEEEETMRLMYLKPQAFHGEHQIGAVTLAISQLRQEISRMLRFANENVNLSFNAVKESTEKDMKRILYNEEYLDYLNAEISKCISRLISMEMPVGDSRIMNGYFKIAGNIERIGDHSMNVAGYAQALKRDSLRLSKMALEEVDQMHSISLQIMETLDVREGEDSMHLLEKIAKMEQLSDDMNERFRQNQIGRMMRGDCPAQASILYSEMLTDFERIGDHALNIAEEYAKMS
ncbi:Na/Pi cotransporter family protein [Lachnotalea sp. AF33-28]|uniref:Na/Pi cotransporter family protein n=1 Tax=Lachnotalea sp. AF33-28 TaxID=2292046 RepID=UPI000E47475B|nr:Na/Pi cotransporter family protein [Lachnotalea sp. AF33-28]RHP32821.1 Na/Pi cotransporter family protein [Lachnotalea sp. AF33-28]